MGTKSRESVNGASAEKAAHARSVKITFGEMRSGGGPTAGILVYCVDYQCGHCVAISADQWPDDMRLSDVEPRFICRAGGKRSADVQPHFQPAKMGTVR